LDKRLTGSSVIDDALQEMLQYIIRDYIENWYGLISSDAEFLYESRQNLQNLTINISNRCKEVDWSPFLTTKLVDIVAAHIRLYRHSKSKGKDSNDKETWASSASVYEIEQIFFDLELAMNNQKLCHKKVCMDPEHEKEQLKMLTDLFLLLVGSKEEINSRPVLLLSSQILVSVIVIPILNLLSDPDYINQCIIWLCKDFPIKSEAFLTVLHFTENTGELDATVEMLNREIALLRSHDLGGEDDIVIKQQLSSLLFVKKIVDHRLQKMQGGSDNDSAASSDWNHVANNPSNRLYQLPLDIILKNNVALSYLLDFMTALGSQSYIFFLLNAEGWKITAEQQLSSMELQGYNVNDEFKKYLAKVNNKAKSELSPQHQIFANMRQAANSIYDQYLSDKANPRLRVDEVVLRRLLFNIKYEAPAESWFDEVKSAVSSKLQKDERLMPAFLKSGSYVKLLAELDLLKDGSKSDEEDTRSLDEVSLGEGSSLGSFDADDAADGSPFYESKSFAAENPFRNATADCVITASISQKGVVKDALSSHAVYAVTVKKTCGAREIDNWIVYRRYSDFHDFHARMESRYKAVANLYFPAKRTFNNMDKLFLERRQYLLNEYLSRILKPEFLAANADLQGYVLQFLGRGSYEHSKGAISRKVDSLVNPFVSSVRTAAKQSVRWVPTNLFSANTRSNDDLTTLQRVSGIDSEGNDNVPLRILLFLFDEVFDLQNGNQWARKRIFPMLRELLRAMYGDVFNRKIVDSVAALTSSEQVAEYIKVIKNSLWPNGSPAMTRPPRDEATRMRTRVTAKTALLSCISDEIKHLIGSETTRQGVLRVFELFQDPVLNRRLLYVLIEALADSLFQGQNMTEFFEKFHTSSS